MAAKRVGIFAGTFDPVHRGHIAFAKAAMHRCNLDQVVFLPERQPRGKIGVTNVADRLQMLRLAIAGQPEFTVMELPDDQFVVATTLPELQQRFAGKKLVFLFGSDIARNLQQWPGADNLLSAAEIAVGLRQGDQAPDLPAIIVPTDHAHVTASHVRNGNHNDIDPAVRDYIAAHRLYANQ